MSFGEPLDHARTGRLIVVGNQRGETIPGAVIVELSARRWRFTPAERWRSGRYQLRVSAELEDVAGNRPGRPFDHEAGEVVGGSAPTGPLIRWFEPRHGDR
ncbi:MAG: hypothetical protein ACT4P7_18645 [Gemmatimonadaceae bacterium]